VDGVVVITGGGSGIGRATAARVARDGNSVAIVDRHGDNARATAAEVTAAGGRAEAYECDVADDSAVTDAVTRAVEEFGRVSGVVTAAGIFHGPDLQPAHRVAVDDFLRVLRVNLVGTFAVIAHALPSLMEDGGSIVTIASTAAIRGHGFGSGYTASKGGVEALTRLLAVQYGPHGVRANCVCPGGVDTPMSAGTFATPDAQARAKKSIPIGRYAQPEDIADVVAFLLSDDARYVTGQTFPVEGGATIT
jgi:NAD(P)-dependent dehydrogenase (short-subunit alcohol dehydrogenase family)